RLVCSLLVSAWQSAPRFTTTTIHTQPGATAACTTEVARTIRLPIGLLTQHIVPPTGTTRRATIDGISTTETPTSISITTITGNSIIRTVPRNCLPILRSDVGAPT